MGVITVLKVYLCKYYTYVKLMTLIILTYRNSNLIQSKVIFVDYVLFHEEFKTIYKDTQMSGSKGETRYR